MCIEVYTRHRRCAHTRFLRWDYCSILIPADRLPSTGRACRRYRLKYVDAKKNEECVECARERAVAEHKPTDSPTSPTFATSAAYAPSTTSPVREETGRGGLSGWWNAPAADPVPMGVGHEVPATSGHAGCTWGALSTLGSESEVARVPKEKETTTEHSMPFRPEKLEVYGQENYEIITAEEVETERMTLTELLRTPLPASFAKHSSAPTVFVPARVEMRVDRGTHQYSAFPVPMREDERLSGWKAPESWGVGGSEEGKETENKDEKKGAKKWFKGMFKYREGYTGGAF